MSATFDRTQLDWAGLARTRDTGTSTTGTPSESSAPIPPDISWSPSDSTAVKLPRARWWWAALLLAALAAFIVWRVRQPGDLEQRLARYRAAGQPVTLAELDASYPAVPDAENAAPPLLEAISGWRSVTDTNLPISGLGPGYPRRGVPWPAPVLAAARAELASNAVPLAGLHAALNRPRSRYPVDLRSAANTLATHFSPVKQAARMLTLEARFAAETGDPVQATAALLASLKAARSLEAEPLLISYLVRIADNAIAVDGAEGVLSRTPLTGPQLEQLQQAFVLAESPDHFGRAFVGERCLALEHFTMPASRLLPLLAAPGGVPANASSGWQEFAQGSLLQLYIVSGIKGHDCAYYLDRMDELIETGARPRTEMLDRQERFGREVRRMQAQLSGILRPFSRLGLPAFEMASAKELRSVTTLRCAQTAMAVERWRLAHGDALPPTLDVLVPQFLAAVPIDLMDGKPLKFRALAKGYVVYSFGEDGLDDGGLPSNERGPDPKDKNKRSNRWDYTFTVTR